MSSRGGFTLVEMAVSLTMMSVIGGIFLLATHTTSSAVRTGVAVVDLDSRAQRALGRVCEALKAASPDLSTPKIASPFSSTTLDFQRGLGTDASGDPIWGPVERLELVYDEANNGLDDDGDGLVDEGTLVWRENPGAADERRIVLCTDVREYQAGESSDGDDDNANGLVDERGFALDFVGGIVHVRLTLEGRDAQGHTIVTRAERTVALRNTGS